MESSAMQKFLRSEMTFYATVATSIVIWLVSILGVYYGMINKIDLLSQKVEIHIASGADLPISVAELKEKVAVLMAEYKK